MMPDPMTRSWPERLGRAVGGTLVLVGTLVVVAGGLLAVTWGLGALSSTLARTFWYGWRWIW